MPDGEAKSTVETIAARNSQMGYQNSNMPNVEEQPLSSRRDRCSTNECSTGKLAVKNGGS
jgi:hypothetical protein